MNMNNLIIPAVVLYGVYRLYNKSVAELHVDVKVLDIRSAQPLAITLHNPNLAPYYISAAQMDVSMLQPNGSAVKIARAEVNEPVYLPPNGSVQIIPTILIGEGVAEAITNFLLAQTLFLSIDGTVTIGAIILPVHFEKGISLESLPSK